MNDGVAMLLERMKTNPEEFISDAGFGYSKWASLIGAFKEHLSEEDRTALNDALCKVYQQRFTEKVMEELIDPKKSKLEQLLDRTKSTPLAGATQGAYTLNSNGGVVSWEAREPLAASSVADAQKYQMEQLRAHLDMHRDLLKEEEKKSKTLFGKLFNYQ